MSRLKKPGIPRGVIPSRSIIDRRTGQIVGPVVPIAKEDWPYSEISPAEVLWRYMDFWKFDDFLAKSALYFSRPDKFIDPFEGRLTEANKRKISASDEAFQAAYRIERSAEVAEVSREIMRRFLFICCWHRARKESREMWTAYTSGAESVAVTTSAKALSRFLPSKRFVQSPVKYHSETFRRTEFGHTSLYFYKPAAYQFEREFRLLLAPREDESVAESEIGRHVPVNLKKLVHRVILHPKATSEFTEKVREVCKKHLGHLRIELSALLP